MLSGALLGTKSIECMVREPDPISHCWRIVLRDLHLLPALLSPSPGEEAVFAWLHALVQKLPQWCDKHSYSNLNSAEKRMQWEDVFATTFVMNNAARCRDFLAERCANNGPKPLLLSLVDEDSYIEKENIFFSGLFSTATNPSIEMLQAATNVLPTDNRGKHKYPFLNMCIKQLRLLSLIQHLWPFVQWERLIREHYSVKLERTQAQEMTVNHIISECTCPDQQQILRSAFEQFTNAWNSVVHILQDNQCDVLNRYNELCDCHPIKPSEMRQMTVDAPITVGCIDPEICSDPSGNLFRLFTLMMSKAHNDFLSMVISLVPGCFSMQALSLGGDKVWLDSSPQIPLLKFDKKYAIVECVDELKSKILEYCVVQIGFGVCTTTVEFSMLESFLTDHLLTSSRFIDLNANNLAMNGEMSKIAPSLFLFKGELLHNNKDLQQQIKDRIVQEPLNNSSLMREEAYLQEPKNCKYALDLLELIMFHATKSLPNPNISLQNYCKDFFLVKDDEFQQSLLEHTLFSQVPMKQLVALYDFVEDSITDFVLFSLPASLPEKYYIPLPLPSLNIVNKACYELGRRLKISNTRGSGKSVIMNAGRIRLELALKRFIYREFKETVMISDPMLDSPLYHHIISPNFPWAVGDKVTSEEIEAAFPEDGDPSFKHAIALWEELKRRDY